MGDGRPSEYTKAKADKFCERIQQGRTVRSVCSDKDMPSAATFYRWLEAHEDFQKQYARAKEIHADMIACECFDIADTADADNVCDEYGNVKPNHEWIARSKLRIDTRKWYLSKVLPKKYGDKLEQTIQGGDKPIEHNHNVGQATTEQLWEIIRGS